MSGRGTPGKSLCSPLQRETPHFLSAFPAPAVLPGSFFIWRLSAFCIAAFWQSLGTCWQIGLCTGSSNREVAARCEISTRGKSPSDRQTHAHIRTHKRRAKREADSQNNSWGLGAKRPNQWCSRLLVESFLLSETKRRLQNAPVEERLHGSARHNTFWPVRPITVCKLHSTAWQQDIDLRQFSEKKYEANKNYLVRWKIQLYYHVSLQFLALRILLAPLDCYNQILAAVKCSTAIVYFFALLYSAV